MPKVVRLIEISTYRKLYVLHLLSSPMMSEYDTQVRPSLDLDQIFDVVLPVFLTCSEQRTLFKR